jgi:hypothetical protein
MNSLVVMTVITVTVTAASRGGGKQSACTTGVDR